MAARKLKLLEDEYEPSFMDHLVNNRFVQGLFTGIVITYLYFKIIG